MIKKLVHFSDLHLKLFKDHDLYQSILTDMLNQFKSIKPDRIVFTGDLVHSKNQVSPELIEMVRWVLDECSKIAKTIIIVGNHDMLESNLSRLDTLTPIIQSMNNDNISYYRNRGVYQDENIDWIVYSLFEHNIPPTIEKSDRLKIGLFHGPIIGLYTDIGYKFETGYEVDKFDGCDLVLCGDIHKRQIFDIPGNKKAYMVGSTIQQNYGESITKHGFGVYNLETNEYSFVDLNNPKPFLSFKLDSYEDIINGYEKLVNG
jgi:DNA repair exonuclease SbcCD nuclease subunit